MRITKKLEQEGQIAQELSMKIIKQYAEVDPLGEVIWEDKRRGIPKVPEEKRMEFAKKIEELNAIAFTIERYRVKLSDIAPAGFPTRELDAIEDILDVSDLDEKPALSLV